MSWFFGVECLARRTSIECFCSSEVTSLRGNRSRAASALVIERRLFHILEERGACDLDSGVSNAFLKGLLLESEADKVLVVSFINRFLLQFVSV